MANKKAEKSNIILTIALSVIIISALTWFNFFYQVGKVSKMSEDVQKEKLDSYVQQEKSDKIFKLKKDLIDVEGRKKEMDAMLPDKDNVVPILRSLETIAAETSNSITISAADLSKIKIGQAKKTSVSAETDDATKKNAEDKTGSTKDKANQDDLAKLKDYPAFNMEVIGTFPAVTDFISKMENLPYFIRVLTLDLVPYEKPVQHSPAGGVSSSENLATAGSNGDELGNKGVKLSLLVVIYINDKK
jgi:hypothetical protein